MNSSESVLPQKIAYILAVTIASAGLCLSIVWHVLDSHLKYVAFPASTLIAFLVIGATAYNKNETPEGYFFHNRKMPPSLFSWTFVTANVGLFSSIFYSTYIAYYFGPAGMIWPMAAWFGGMWLFAHYSRRLIPFFKTGASVHDFIGKTYGQGDIAKETLLRRLTSTVSLSLLWCSLAIELKFASSLAASSLGIGASWLIATAIAATGTAYTYFAGYRGTVRTDRVQGLLMAMGAIALITFSIRLASQSPINVGDEYLKVTGYFIGPAPFSLIAMVVLLLPYQFCVMDMWQRCIAIAHSNPNATEDQQVQIIKRVAFRHAVLPFLLMFVAWYACGVTAKWTGLSVSPETVLFDVLAYLFNSPDTLTFLIAIIVCAAFIGAVITTFDSFLIAFTQGFMYDWWGLSRPHLRSVITSPATATADQNSNFVAASRFWLSFAGISAVAITAFQFEFISFWVGMYSLMLAFLPCVITAIIFPRFAQRVKPVAAATSIVSGFMLALSSAIAGTLFSATAFGVSLTDIGTILSPCISCLILVASPRVWR